MQKEKQASCDPGRGFLGGRTRGGAPTSALSLCEILGVRQGRQGRVEGRKLGGMWQWEPPIPIPIPVPVSVPVPVPIPIPIIRGNIRYLYQVPIASHR